MTPNDKLSNSATSTARTSTARTSTARTPAAGIPAQVTSKRSLMIMIVLYALWLVGLAYVAWVNVQAGNQ